MIYFTHQELATNYHVSVKTVRNWIDASKQGKLNLVLHEHSGRPYISNTAGNTAIIEQLVQKGKKYRPHRTVKVVSPQPQFYQLYTKAQIYDIINSLDVHREIPLQYGYFNGGADYWDKYAERLVRESAPNLLTRTIKLLEINRSYIDELISNYKRVNVVDVGVGNARPVKELIEHLLEQKKMGRYVGVDISREMLQIAERNIKAWFGDQVEFCARQADFSYERFTDVVAQDALGKDAGDTVNLVLFFGGTVVNFREPDSVLEAIHDSMGRNDLFLQTRKLDSPTLRSHFDLNSEPGSAELPPIHRYVIDMLSIDKTCYAVERGFDETRHERYTRVRLKVAVIIEFDFGKEGKRRIELNKDDAILLWRSWHLTDTDVVEQFNRCNFHILQSSQTDDWEYLLTIAQIKRS